MTRANGRYQSYEWIVRRLPAKLAAMLDFTLRPRVAHGFDGPLNGQERRRELFEDLLRRHPFRLIVETGTFRGTTTRYFAEHAPRVITVEVVPRLYEFARLSLRNLPNVELVCGDSRHALGRLAKDTRLTSAATIFYLDAHATDDLPLADELRIIADAWSEALVMVDDFAVPGDTGYGFDDYGPTRRLTEALLPCEHMPGWEIFYPKAESSQETGARRGTLVAASPALAPTVAASPLVSRRKMKNAPQPS